jgi:hypothetical protein
MRRLWALATIVSLIYAASGAIAATTTSLPEDMTVAAENEWLVLLVNEVTAEFAVVDKNSGFVWFSNPQAISERETVARGSARDVLEAQLAISYYSGSQKLTMNSHTDSVDYGQFSVEMIPDGVRIEYELGRRWKDEDYVPIMIGSTRFREAILDHLSDSDAEFVLSQYIPVTLHEVDNAHARTEVYNLDVDAVFGQYTLVRTDQTLSDSQRRSLIELFVDYIVANRHDVEGRKSLTSDDVSQLKDEPVYIMKDRVRPWDMTKIISLVKAAGYTPDDKAMDHGANHLDPPQPNPVTFTVTMEVRLDGSCLVVTIPASGIRYPKDTPVSVLQPDGDKITVPLYSISVLPYFGAAWAGEDGYIFVPDGVGALIHFDNGRLYAPPYEQRIYGADLSLAPIDQRTSNRQQVYVPVFGLKRGEAALVAIIEEGDAAASIKADVSGRLSSLNTVSSEFVIFPRAETSLRGSPQGFPWLMTTSLPVYQSRPISSDIRIRYSFLTGDQASYVGMARSYQSYIVEQYGLEKQAAESDTPFIAEFIGAVTDLRPVLGITREVTVPVTTYAQVLEGVRGLMDRGVDSIALRLSGWMSGGMRQAYPAKVDLEPRLGTSSEFLGLSTTLRDLGVRLYPDVDFLNVFRDSWFDGFSPKRDASRFMNRNVAEIYDYDLATFERSESKAYLLSPTRLLSLLSGFLDSLAAYPVDALSVGSMGTQLHSDYREDPQILVDRQQAKDIVGQALESIAAREMSVMVDGGNSFALGAADIVVNMPLESSMFSILDKAVPFLPIVAHGYVDYAGTPLNLSASHRDAFLHTVEIGASLYYKWIFSESSTLKGSPYDYLCSTGYHDWVDIAADAYMQVSEVSRAIRGRTIVNHEEISEDVFRTTYEGGVSVIVNYANSDVIVDGLVVQGRSFAVAEGSAEE